MERRKVRAEMLEKKKRHSPYSLYEFHKWLIALADEEPQVFSAIPVGGLSTWSVEQLERRRRIDRG